ncbi:MAG TPA: HlyU family transcriptional regulator [Beijerinckiaceae bacterium]|nr:HlyU family transcriptional regulator [Beijerinckiaceae bacterium]
MSFFAKLFGKSAAQAPEPVNEDYRSYILTATPYQEAGQWQMCGVISKEIGNETKQHRFVRADRFPSREDAVEFTLKKARQIVDLNGDRIFS